jgi:hypothetical protein
MLEQGQELFFVAEPVEDDGEKVDHSRERVIWRYSDCSLVISGDPSTQICSLEQSSLTISSQDQVTFHMQVKARNYKSTATTPLNIQFFDDLGGLIISWDVCNLSFKCRDSFWITESKIIPTVWNRVFRATRSFGSGTCKKC